MVATRCLNRFSVSNRGTRGRSRCGARWAWRSDSRRRGDGEAWGSLRGCGPAGGLRAGILGLISGGTTTAGASLGCPGQEGVQAGSGGGGAAVAGAFLQVVGQQAEGLDVVPGGGGGDGPDVGGQVGGPLGAGAVEVLAADDRGPQRSFRSV